MFTLENFYQSDKWVRFVQNLKMERVNDDGLLICEECGKPIQKKYDCVAHHTIELTDDNVNDFNISMNPANIKLIHFGCHNKQHKRNAEGLKQKVYLVYGAPCAGKTTWVRSVANDDDLILDIDAIWACISMQDKYHKNNRLKANVFGIRDCIIDQIRTRKGMWRNAYIIGGYPLKTDRERLIDLLRAEPIFIDTPKETCIERAKTDDWRTFIETWYESYTE